jgi:MATE family multidrug resistance protein
MSSTSQPTPPVTGSAPTAAVEPQASTAGGSREVLILAYPVILTQISMTAMGIVDSAMVGSIGATELGAVGFGGIWLWTFVCFFVGTTSGVQTFVSQREGAGDPRACGSWAWQGLYAVVPMGALATLILYFGAEAGVRLLGPSEALQPLASSYVSARSLGMVGILCATSFGSFFRGIGDTRTPLYVTLVANGVNVVLDYGLIFGKLGLPEMGVTGAGVATAIAEWTYGIIMAWAFLRPALRSRFATDAARAIPTNIRRLVRTGAPIGGQWWLEMISFSAFTTLVARMGDASMAASQAFVALLSISFMQAIGLSIAVSTLVGQYIGANQPQNAERAFRSGLKLAALLAGVIAVLFSTVPDHLVGIFTSDPEVIRLGRPLMIVGALFQFFDAFGIIADGALRGAGDTRWPFLVRLVLAWGVFVPMAYWVGIVMDGGLTWAWAAGAVHVLLLATTLVVRFRSGAWRHIVI